MIQARNRFLSLDYNHFLRKKIASLFLTYLTCAPTCTFCDLACGEGYYTNFIHQTLTQIKPTKSFGID